MEKTKATVDSKYIQQHLANERTFLAWVRTALAVKGIGFLVMSLDFSAMSEMNKISEQVTKVIGLISLVFGILMITFSTISYYRKRKDINQQEFTASKGIVGFVSVFLLLLAFIYGIYIIYL